MTTVTPLLMRCLIKRFGLALLTIGLERAAEALRIIKTSTYIVVG